MSSLRRRCQEAEAVRRAAICLLIMNRSPSSSTVDSPAMAKNIKLILVTLYAIVLCLKTNTNSSFYKKGRTRGIMDFFYRYFFVF